MKKLLIAVVAMFIGSSSDAFDKSRIDHIDFLNQGNVAYGKVEDSQIVSQLAENEMNAYCLTWDSNKTLEQNQQALLETFIETCCDFSFKWTSADDGELCYGQTSSDTKILLYNEKNMFHLLSLLRNNSGECIILNEAECLQNCDFNSYKEKILNALQILSRSPIGCELFRVMLAKHKTSNMPKTIFIPCHSKNKTMPIETRLVLSVMKSKECEADKWRGDIFLRNTVILFDFEEYERINFLFVSISDQKNDDFVLFNQQLPLDAVLLHEMIHVMHMPVHLESLEVDFTIDWQFASQMNVFTEMEAFIETNKLCDIMLLAQIEITGKHCFINSRYNLGVIINNFTKLIDVWTDFLSNDEEFITMFGIGLDGLNLLNEAAYMAETYKRIRVSHYIAQDQVYGTTCVSKENMENILIDFIIKCGDFDLYKFYLAPSSPVKYPRFGINQYECSHLEPETGMPKNIQ